MNTVNWNEAFATARLIRDASVLHHADKLTPDLIPRDLMPIDRFGGASLFEICIAIFIVDCDREQVASLFESAVDASKSYEQLEDFILEMRGCAQTDFKRIGFFTGA